MYDQTLLAYINFIYSNVPHEIHYMYMYQYICVHLSTRISKDF